MITMFDLPMKTTEDRRVYAAFRKMLLQSGYRLFQRSVYIKLLRNVSSANREIHLLDSIAPQVGHLQTITLNLNVFKTLTALRGEEFDMSLFSDDVICIGNDDECDASDLDDATLLEMERRLKRPHGEENEHATVE